MTNEPSLLTIIVAIVALLAFAAWMHRKGDKTGRGIALAFAGIGVVSAIGHTMADSGYTLMAMF